MTVQSYLELFTTMYGWGFAAIFKDILVGTGLIYLPFIFLVLGTWMEAHKRASTDGADAGWMIRVMEVELGIAIFVLAMCFTTIPGNDRDKRLSRLVYQCIFGGSGDSRNPRLVVFRHGRFLWRYRGGQGRDRKRHGRISSNGRNGESGQY